MVRVWRPCLNLSVPRGWDLTLVQPPVGAMVLERLSSLAERSSFDPADLSLKHLWTASVTP